MLKLTSDLMKLATLAFYLVVTQLKRRLTNSSEIRTLRR